MIRSIHKLRKARPACPVIKSMASRYGVDGIIPEEQETNVNFSATAAAPSCLVGSKNYFLRLDKNEGVRLADPTEKWEIMEMLGEGGFSKIFKAKNKQDENDLAAAKIIIDSEETSDIFRNEFEILKRLKHANIVRIREAYHFDDQLWVYFINIFIYNYYLLL